MKIFSITVLIVAVAAGIWFWPKAPNASQGRSAAAMGRPATAEVVTRDIEFSISVAGEISPKEEVSVRPEVNGRISELPVDVGDRVKRGDLLFSLDDRDLQIEIASRQTEIQSAQLQLEKAKRDYEREQRLFEEKLISREAFEDAKTSYELALNSIERAERNLDLAKDRLSKTRIMAPFECTVLTRPVTGVGQAVSGSGGYNSGTEVMTIANLNEMVIHAHVNQVDVARMKQGQTVDIQVEAVTGLRVDGEVQRIAPQATIKNGIKGFAVRILIEEMDERIQPGMTANISIPVASAEKVVAAPLAAVFTEYNEESGQNERFAYVRSGGKFRRQPIGVGISDYFHAEVLSGLKAGDVVALEPPPPEAILEQAATPAMGKNRGGPSGT